MQHPLPEVSVLKQCPASWRKMKGDNQVRFCTICKRNVYNLSDMTTEQAYQVLADAEGRFCSRFYKRKDGTIVTAECPKPERAKFWFRGIVSALLAGVGITVALPLATPAYAGATKVDWSKWSEKKLKQIQEVDRQIAESQDPKDKEELRDLRRMLFDDIRRVGGLPPRA